jgi:hypothetical protein
MSFASCVKGLMDMLNSPKSRGTGKKTYLLTKAVEDVQLIPTIRCTTGRTLILFVSLVW